MKRQTLKRAVFIVLLSLITALILGACQAGGDAQTTGGEQVYYSFIDDVGNEVVLKKKPQKVAVLFSSFADVWKTAGGTVSITVGESVERGFAGADVPLVDKGAGKTIDSELLVSYQPDFVICSADLEAQVKAAELLVRSGIPSAVFHVESFEDYLSMLKICTDITGNAQAYTTYGADVAARIKQIKDAVHSKIEQSQQKQILFVRAGSKYSATKAKTAADNFVCAMLAELGTYNIAEKAPVLLDGLSFEEVLSSNPDYIFISTMGDEEAAKAYMDSVLAQDEWRHLDAVQNSRYTYLPKDLFQFKPNARWDEAYRYLAGLLYPDGV